MELTDFLKEWNNNNDLLLVHTSGSTGVPKPLWVEKCRMEASARRTCDFLGLHPGDTALLCMPLDYIAGKMMVVRSLVGGLRLVSVPPSGHPLCHAGTDKLDFAAMVPLQVYNSLQVEEERQRLMQIRHLIIGGGPVDEEMAAALSAFPHAVWSTYGMTETLSHIALRRISGPSASEWYTPFPSVSVDINDEHCLVIDAPEVCPDRLVTNDIAELSTDPHHDRPCRFRILGRKDNVVCSGGVKIQMEEVERRLRPHLPLPFLITKYPDHQLGEAVAMLLQSPDVETARAACRASLPRYWQPRTILSVDSLPTTATGKPARAEAQRLVREQILSRGDVVS